MQIVRNKETDMKTKIEIILGFLESGKTSFINTMLLSNEINDETVVVIMDEFGVNDIYNNLDLEKKNVNLIILENNIDNDINETYIKYVISTYNPDRIFIEANGMKNSNSLIETFKNINMKKLCRIDDVIALVDAEKFNLYYVNLKNLLVSQIYNSTKIILTNINNLSESNLTEVIQNIKNINETAVLLKYSPSENVHELSTEPEYIELNPYKNNLITFKTYIYIFLIMFSFTILCTLSLSNILMYDIYLNKFQNFYTIFTSILIEGLPFILIGSFISSLIQNFISKEFILRLFTDNIFLSCITAAFAGLIFPICDCGTIPVAKGLIQKKVPIAACVTFMLAAPIVNPITIISTIYAFQGSKSIVICRIGSGIIISILVGLAMHFSTKKSDYILKDNNNSFACECAICNESSIYQKNIIQKMKDIFLHTGNEFFNIGKFMIMGTLLSSLFQCFISINNNIYIPNDNRSSLIIMILLSFFLSVCSTSDAFIAKGFLSIFSINSIMGFLVTGPMLDIKNTFILFGNFKKSFVIKLIFFILTISFAVLINIKLS